MNKFTRALLITTCVLLLGACYQEYSTVATQTCSLHLQVFVRQGSRESRTVSGDVDFGSDTGSSFKRDLVDENGLSHPGSFYFNGPAIHFILALEEGEVYATGMMESNLATCSGTGGGTLSGPLAGDLGDWRGEWSATPIPMTPVQPGTNDPSPSLLSSVLSTLFCGYSPFIVLAFFLAILLLRLFAPYRLLAPFKRTRPQTPASALRRTGQEEKPGPEGRERPLAEYLATYTAEDKLFDLSFQIEQSSRYLGECGITVAKVLDAESGQAAALEIWLSDPHGPQTVSRVLAGSYCFTQESLRHELEQIGKTTLIRPGETILLETKGIKVFAKVLQVEYELNSPHLQSLFKKVVIEIKAWANTE